MVHLRADGVVGGSVSGGGIGGSDNGDRTHVDLNVLNEKEIRSRHNELLRLVDGPNGRAFIHELRDVVRVLSKLKASSQSSSTHKATGKRNINGTVQPKFVNIDNCPQCGTNYTVLATACIVICPNEQCGFTTKHLQPEPETDSYEKAATVHERGPLYRKFLMQFHPDAPDPTDEVIRVVRHELAKVHTLLPSKVKPTPIAQILRKAHMPKWAALNIRIARIINGQTIPVIPQDLIDRLVHRFVMVTKEFTFTSKNQGRSKNMNYGFLTKHFLLMEGEVKLSESFPVHKTRVVLRAAHKRLKGCCRNLQKADDGLFWICHRSS